MKKTIKAVIFDFGNVLSEDYFYTTLDPEIYEKISYDIFHSPNKLADDWMRGEINSHDVNRVIADKHNLSLDLLERELEKSVKLMKLNNSLLDFAREIKKKKVKIILLTDNMDIFQEVLVPHNKLNLLFDFIMPSFEHKMLKQDDNGRLANIAISKLGVNYPETLFIDDSKPFGEIIENKGGNFYLYKKGSGEKGVEEFIKWFYSQFQIDAKF